MEQGKLITATVKIIWEATTRIFMIRPNPDLLSDSGYLLKPWPGFFFGQWLSFRSQHPFREVADTPPRMFWSIMIRMSSSLV